MWSVRVVGFLFVLYSVTHAETSPVLGKYHLSLELAGLQQKGIMCQILLLHRTLYNGHILKMCNYFFYSRAFYNHFIPCLFV
jgi:hypothetical protein